jgi:hypothetical protein
MGGVSSDGVAIRSEDRSVVWVERIDGCGDGTYRTTDEQWQSIVDCIAAAPEMLATLRDLSREIRAGSILDAGSIGDWGRYIDEVIAKAEPPRKVKQRVIVEVEIEMDVEPGCPTVTILDTASCAVGCGGNDTVRHVRTSTRLG